MPRIPIFRLGLSKERVDPLKLARYTPHLVLDDLSAGIDNLRHDVYLSPKFVEQMRVQITRLVARHGNVEGLLAADHREEGAWCVSPLRRSYGASGTPTG